MKIFRKLLSSLFWIPARALMGLLWVYRKTLSPDHGPIRHFFPYGFCRHHPTCSTYAMHQLKTRLLPIAVGKIVGRIVRCTPWTKPSDKKMKKVIEKSLR